MTGLTNGITYEFKVVSSRVGFEDVASTIVPAKPQVLSAATVQPMPVVTPEQVAANAVAPIVFIVPNATMASTTPGSVTNDITIVVQPSTQMEVDQLEIKASEVIPAGVIAPSGTLVPKRFVEISPQTNLGAKIEATIDYISVSAGYPATLGETPDFSRFALYYNHNRVTYPVKRTEDVVLRTTDFFWYNTTDADPATNDTYTFKTRVFSTLMSVVGDNAAAEAVTATETVPTPASSAWTIAILALIALGVTCVVGRKAGIN